MNRQIRQGCGRYSPAVLLLVGSAVVGAEVPVASAPQAVAGVPNMPGSDYLLQLLLSLLVVVVSIVAVAWILRRVMHMQGAGGGNMRVLAGLSLGSRERVVVVEVGDTQLLLGVAPGRVVSLHVFDKPVFAQPEPATGLFAKYLHSKIEGSSST